MEDQTPPPKTQTASSAPPTSIVIPFAQLSQGSREVIIEHEGQVYRLRLTRNGKLILNK
ncbi:hemin uptake protein HemP [Rubinisphaera margarita]|uniref:hemin uptake protein HemP n=1 Tax=Rubinisphaera margarita TaxID=2909586 RepID=UPI001EE9736C|nr:hemin uptake protein HemP [Rubinisphaera margarita]MCG6154563.1 hemin uptake protein HemP [Rubinisphaera margarita]